MPIQTTIDDIFTILLTGLNFTGLNPLKPHPVKTLIVMSVFSLSAILTVCSVIFDEHNFDNITASIIAISAVSKTILTAVTLIANREKLKSLLEETGRFWAKTKTIDDGIDRELKRHKRFLIACTIFFSMLVVAFVREVLAGTPAYKYYVTGFFVAHPVTFQVFQLMFLINTVVLAGSFSFLFRSLVILLSLEFQFLGKRIASINFSEESSGSVHGSLKESVIWHQILVRRILEMNKIFGPMLLIHLWTIGSMICLFTFSFVTNPNIRADALKGFSQSTVLLFEMMIFYFMPSQYLLKQQAEIPICIYNTDWYNAGDKSVRATLTTFFTISQNTFRIVAGNFVPMDMETATNAFKMMMTYFNYLQTMNE